jgi:hypothetical protein
MSKVSVLRDYQSLLDVLMEHVEVEENIDTRMEMLRDMLKALRIIHALQQEY